MPERSDLGPLDGILGLHVRLAHGAIARHFGRSFAELGLTQKQVSVLWLIAEGDGAAIQAELGTRLQMDRATVMAIVHGLERKGLVERSAVPGDARKRGFGATDAGLRVLDQAKRAIAEHERWLRSRFGPEEVVLLQSMLRRISGAGVQE